MRRRLRSQVIACPTPFSRYIKAEGLACRRHALSRTDLQAEPSGLGVAHVVSVSRRAPAYKTRLTGKRSVDGPYTEFASAHRLSGRFYRPYGACCCARLFRSQFCFDGVVASIAGAALRGRRRTARKCSPALGLRSALSVVQRCSTPECFDVLLPNVVQKLDFLRLFHRHAKRINKVTRACHDLNSGAGGRPQNPRALRFDRRLRA